MTLDSVLARIDSDLDPAIERLKTLLRIPSVSTDPAYAADCARAAEWLVEDLRSFGVAAEARPTRGHPVVVGHVEGDGPHLLFYGHYDVQPVDPVALWQRDPFDPAVEETDGGRLVRARGASDDKGQLMTFVEACRAWQAAHGRLPVRVTFLLEGEEESGSPSLAPFLRANADEFAADLALVCDTSMIAPGAPSIAGRLRGMMKEEFTLHGPVKDLHSGHYGGPALNPLREIARIVASFHDAEGRVRVPHFYDGVAEITDDQRRQWEVSGFDEAAYLGEAGMTRAHGETGFSALEQQWARPTLEINGMWGGYTGAGMKTVIPAEAHCKLTCRLVDAMDPETVRANLRAHVEAELAPDSRVSWGDMPDGAPAVVIDTDRPAFAAARQALSDEWGREAVFSGMGGSIPIVSGFRDILGLEAMLVGFALEDDAIHSPNEKYDVRSFHKGARSWARILDALAG